MKKASATQPDAAPLNNFDINLYIRIAIFYMLLRVIVPLSTSSKEKEMGVNPSRIFFLLNYLEALSFVTIADFFLAALFL